MTWKGDFLNELRESFGNKPFTVADAMKLEKTYSRPIVYGLLSEFAKDDSIGRYGRGIYVVDPINRQSLSSKIGKTSKPDISLLPTARDVESALTIANIDF